MQPSFNEIQRFNKWWHYLLAGFPVLLTAGIVLLAWIHMSLEKQEKDPAALVAMGSALAVTALTFVWFLLLELHTSIDEHGISVTYKWIPFCKRNIPWSDIKSIDVIDYSPLSDYGGWGVRYSISGNGWCYNVSGDKGIKLFYQNGKPFLIGTQQAEKAKTIIEQYFKH